MAIAAHRRGITLKTLESQGSTFRYLWSCQNGHEWRARYDSLVDGKGCPECYRATLPTQEERVERKRRAGRDYYRSHKVEKRKYDSAYEQRRRREDPEFKLVRNMRARIRMAIRHGAKTGSSVADLGCTIPELKAYLESKFLPGMRWENWGVHGWHIDHVRPLSSFDLTDRAQFIQAVHYTNLQPLWAVDNLKKGSDC